MTWVLGYLIGLVLCVIVLAFTGYNDDETVWLAAVMWPLILIGYFLIFIYAIGTFFIDKYFYIIDKIRRKNECK